MNYSSMYSVINMLFLSKLFVIVSISICFSFSYCLIFVSIISSCLLVLMDITKFARLEVFPENKKRRQKNNENKKSVSTCAGEYWCEGLMPLLPTFLGPPISL